VHFLGKERVFGRYLQLVDHRPERNAELTDFDRWLRRVDSPDLAKRLWYRREAFRDLDTTLWAYPVNASMSLGYQEISGYDPFSTDRVHRLFRAIPFRRSWDLFGVTFVVTPHRVALDGLERVHRTDALHVYRNTSALPRVVVPSRIEGFVDPETVLERMAREDFDAATVALLEGPLPVGLAPDGQARGIARVVDYQPDRVTIDARMDHTGLVVLHDVHHPDWTVLVDGMPADLLRVNYVFRGVQVEPGEHRVELVFRPSGFVLSAWVSLLCWVGCLGVTGHALWTRRRPPEERP
jgi:hypothetical protein